MAGGKGVRLRPYTLKNPKPLIKIAGKTIVQRIVDLVLTNPNHKIKNLGFVIDQKNKI